MGTIMDFLADLISRLIELTGIVMDFIAPYWVEIIILLIFLTFIVGFATAYR